MVSTSGRVPGRQEQAKYAQGSTTVYMYGSPAIQVMSFNQPGPFATQIQTDRKIADTIPLSVEKEWAPVSKRYPHLE